MLDNFENFLVLRDDELRVKWLGEYDANRKLWSEVLEPQLGRESLTRFSGARRKELLEPITHKTVSKHRLTAKSRKVEAVLNDILELADKDELRNCGLAIHEEPQKTAQSIRGALLRELAVASLTIEEQRRVLRICLQRMREASREDREAYAAVTLELLLGLTPHEVCGINCGDLKNDGGLQYIAVSRIYYQERRKDPEMRSLLSEEFQYRAVPLTHWVLDILGEFHRLNSSGRDSKAPLFRCCGRRLTPDVLKNATKETLRLSMDTPSAIDSLSEDEEWKLVTRGDLLRNNADMQFRNLCGMTVAETDVMLGRQPAVTYAKYYVDWRNSGPLEQLRAKLQFWHATLFNEELPCADTASDGSREYTSASSYDARSGIFLTGCGGGQIRLSAENSALDINISAIETEREEKTA